MDSSQRATQDLVDQLRSMLKFQVRMHHKFVCMYIYIYIYIFITRFPLGIKRMHMGVCLWLYVPMYDSLYACMFVYVYVCVCVCVCIYIYIYASISTYHKTSTHIKIYTYKYACIHRSQPARENEPHHVHANTHKIHTHMNVYTEASPLKRKSLSLMYAARDFRISKSQDIHT